MLIYWWKLVSRIFTELRSHNLNPLCLESFSECLIIVSIFILIGPQQKQQENSARQKLNNLRQKKGNTGLQKGNTMRHWWSNQMQLKHIRPRPGPTATSAPSAAASATEIYVGLVVALGCSAVKPLGFWAADALGCWAMGQESDGPTPLFWGLLHASLSGWSWRETSWRWHRGEASWQLKLEGGQPRARC